MEEICCNVDIKLRDYYRRVVISRCRYIPAGFIIILKNNKIKAESSVFNMSHFSCTEICFFFLKPDLNNGFQI